MLSTRKFCSSIVSTLFVVGLYGFLYLPIVVLVVFSFNKEPFPAPWAGFTWHWYHQLWYNSDQIWAALYNSLIVSLSATFLSLIMAVGLIYNMVQGGRIRKMITIFYANLIVPEIVLAVGLLIVFTLCSIPLGKMTLIVVHTVLGLGYAVPVLYTRYEELDTRLIEASLDLGANYQQTFAKIILPLISNSLVVGGLLVFIISFDDFVLSYFCSGTSAQTLPIYILSMLRTGVSPVVNALSTGLLMFSSLLVIVFCFLRARMRL